MLKKYKPNTRAELKKLVNQLDDLSLINTSLITDMSYLFSFTTRKNFLGINA